MRTKSETCVGARRRTPAHVGVTRFAVASARPPMGRAASVVTYEPCEALRRSGAMLLREKARARGALGSAPLLSAPIEKEQR